MEYENKPMEEQATPMTRSERRKRNLQKEKGKKKLPLWLKCIGCVVVPYLFILLMGVVNAYAMSVNVAFVLAGSIVLLLGMIVITVVTTRHKKV